MYEEISPMKFARLGLAATAFLAGAK